MRTTRAFAALLLIALGSCTDSSNPVHDGSTASSPALPNASAAPPGCPTDVGSIESLFAEPIAHVEGAVNGSASQVCAFLTSSSDVGALSVTYLRFPRSDLPVRNLAGARRRYGSPLPGHTIVSMPSWGIDAFLDESTLPSKDLVAEFAWVPGFEIILGMRAADPHVGRRRQVIDRLVAFTQ